MSKKKKQFNNKPKEIKKEKKDILELTALRNTFLADGTFVKKGDKVKVSEELAERIKKEKSNNFK